MSSLHILPFAMQNPYTLSLDPSGYFPVDFRLMTTKNPPITSLDLAQFTGKRILITGATGGCGIEFAKALADQTPTSRHAARTPSLLTQHGITHVLTLARWQDLSPTYATFPGTLETNIDPDPATNNILGLKLMRKYVELDDDPAEDILRSLERMLDWIHEALTQPHPRCEAEDSFHPETDTASHILHMGGRVLVHCNQGISRSGAVVVAYMMRTFSIPYTNALALARESRSIVYPNIGFEYQLRIWGGCDYEVYHEVREHNWSSDIIIIPKAGYTAWKQEVASVHLETRFMAYIRAREDWLRSLQARLDILNCS
ncbi:protein-tyrosine phosphatase-like protein [Aspergillus crustosus]